MTRAAKPGQQMAYLTIGYQGFLMDPAKAMKVMEMMQHAVNADQKYDRADILNDTYEVDGPVNLQLRLVPAHKVRMPGGEAAPVKPAGPRLLK